MRRTGVAIFAVLAIVVGACSQGGTEPQKLSAVASKLTSTTSSSTTSTTSAPTETASVAVAVAAKRIQRVHTLPAGESSPRPATVSKAATPKAATSRGPTPTGRISIPRIGLDHPTYEGIDLATIDYGPSHWPGTALPGQVGNTVFPGHRVTHDHPFFDIDLIRIGDNVTFSNDTGRFTYQVTDTFVVNADQTSVADPTDTPTMTIFGCHPKHSAKQRYVVKGKLVKSVRTAPSGGSGSGGYQTAPDPSPPPPPPEQTTTTTQPNGVKIPSIGG